MAMNRAVKPRAIAWTALAALFFAQALVAFAGCDMPVRSPASVIAADNPACHESSGEMNICVAHCLAADQSLDKPQSSIPTPPAVHVLVLQPVSEAPYVHAAALRHLAPPAAAPPPRILFRTLRI